MSSTKSVTSTTFPTASLLGVAFIILKLTNVIAWSWWWVLAPFWIPLAIWLAIMIICALILGAIKLADKK